MEAPDYEIVHVSSETDSLASLPKCVAAAKASPVSRNNSFREEWLEGFPRNENYRFVEFL